MPSGRARHQGWPLQSTPTYTVSITFRFLCMKMLRHAAKFIRFISEAFFESHVQVEIQSVDAQKHVCNTFLLQSRHSNLPQVVPPLKLSPLAGPQGPALVQNDSLECYGKHRWGWQDFVGVECKSSQSFKETIALVSQKHTANPDPILCFSPLHAMGSNLPTSKLLLATWRLNFFMATTLE